MRPDPLDPDDDRKPCCPDCGSHTIYPRTGKGGASVPAHGHKSWRCESCDATFDTPGYSVPESITQVTRPRISAIGRAAIEAEREAEP